MAGTMSPILIGTVAALSAWGRWGKGPNLGLPTMSPMFGERSLKTPLYTEDNPDPWVMAVDNVVCRLLSDERAIIIRKYQHRWRVRQFIGEYKWSVRRYYAELERAVWAVHVKLGD